jgi:hypothetical protein
MPRIARPFANHPFAAANPQLVVLAQNVLSQSLAVSTRAGYRSAVNHLRRFHEKQPAASGLNKLDYPVTPETLCLWMADSVDKLTFQSIRTYLHGIATTQVELGYPSPLSKDTPQSPLIWRMFKAIKRIQGKQVVRKRLPITVRLLIHLDPLFDTSKELDLCMRAAMWLGTCGLLRAGEFTTKPTTHTTLKLQHLTFHDRRTNVLDPHDLLQSTDSDPPFYMSVRLEQSKTDPFRQGTSVIVGNRRAIQYMLEYLRHRTLRLSRQPLFTGVDGQALTTAALVKFTQALIERANIPNKHLFLGHSFRKGGATSLHEAGHPDSLIQEMGRWASFAFATYVDTPLYMLIAAGRSLRDVEQLHSTAAFSPQHSGAASDHSSFWDVNNLL